MSQNESDDWIQEIRNNMGNPPLRENESYYQLGATLGHGGMGAVFLARLQPLGVLRALKVLRVTQSESENHKAEERFLREARIMGNLRHPAAVKALEFQAYYMENSTGQKAKRPSYFTYAMEPCLVTDEELRHICTTFQVQHSEALEQARAKSHGSVSLQTFLDVECIFPERTVAHFARELIAVLRSAHEQVFEIGGGTITGIVHRDVKPSNILVGPDGRLRLTDFGISKTASRSTNGGELSNSIEKGNQTMSLGTAGYAAPEQWAGNGIPITKEADYYSLGILLRQLLTGQHPRTPSFDKPINRAGISRHWDVLLRGMIESVSSRRLADPDLLDYEFSEIEERRG